MKKKLMWIISWIALITLILFWFFAYKEMNDYTNIIKLNRWIQIPKEANVEEIYSKDSWESFHWDGIRYHVYSYENQEVVESMLDWVNALHMVPENYWGLFEPVDIRLDELDVETKYSPTITQVVRAYYKKQQDNSEILILLNDIEKKLYIFESFL